MQRVDHCVLPPGLCFICESTPGEGTEVVDTERNFLGPAPSHLDGRKYLCGACIKGAGEKIGLASEEARVQAEAERDDAVGRLAALRNRFRSFADEFTQERVDAAEAEAPVVAVAKAKAKA